MPNPSNSPANSPAEIISQLLQDLALGVAPQANNTPWQTFDSDEPDSPDNCITCYDTLGHDDGRSNLDGTLWAHYGVQVRIRSKGFAAGNVKAIAIRAGLAGVSRRAVHIGTAAYWVPVVANIGQVISLGKNKPETMRNLFTINLTLPFEVNQ